MTALITLGVVALLVSVGSFVYHSLWENPYEDTGLFLGFGALVAALVVLVLVVGIESERDHERLMRQCMADGHPEYECYSKLKQDVVPVPIVFPVVR